MASDIGTSPKQSRAYDPAALDATGGTVTGLTKLGVRDTSAAFDVDIAATSSTALTAKRTLTFDMGNADRTLTLPVSSTTTLTGEVTGSGSGSFATTIAAGAVTLAKQANLAANSLQGNNTGSPATPLALTVAQVKVLLGYVLAPSTQSGNTYTPVLADQDRPVQMTYAGASAVTLPQDSDLAFPVGGVIPFKCANAAGKITFAAGSGATMTVARVGCASLIPQNPWGVIYKSAANTWELIGPFVG